MLYTYQHCLIYNVIGQDRIGKLGTAFLWRCNNALRKALNGSEKISGSFPYYLRGEIIMKNKKFRKLAAAIAACTLMASAMPVVPAVSYAAKNIITNSTFDSGTADWSTYKESGGVCSLSTDNGRLALTVSNVGKVNYAVQLCYDVIPLYKNGVYRLKYDISSTQDRFIEAMIQQNGGTYKAYTWKGINLTSTPQTVDYEFTMEDDTDIMAKLVFNCGIQEKYEGELPEHTIYLDNVSLELVDDSNVDYSEIKTPENNINIDQVGYRTNSRKVAVLRGVTNQNNFSVINADTKQEVYSGQLESKGTLPQMRTTGSLTSHRSQLPENTTSPAMALKIRIHLR